MQDHPQHQCPKGERDKSSTTARAWWVVQEGGGGKCECVVCGEGGREGEKGWWSGSVSVSGGVATYKKKTSLPVNLTAIQLGHGSSNLSRKRMKHQTHSTSLSLHFLRARCPPSKLTREINALPISCSGDVFQIIVHLCPYFFDRLEESLAQHHHQGRSLFFLWDHRRTHEKCLRPLLLRTETFSPSTTSACLYTSLSKLGKTTLWARLNCANISMVNMLSHHHHRDESRQGFCKSFLAAFSKAFHSNTELVTL